MTSKATDIKAAARDRLLNAAMKIFALYGFDGASTRMLTKEAGVNISAIPYYFTSKEGLYRAVLECIASMAERELAAPLQALQKDMEAKDFTPAKARAHLHAVIEKFTRLILSEKASPHMVHIMIREQMEPTSAFDALYEKTLRPMHETVTRLVAFLTGQDSDSEEATLCTFTLLGQTAVFKTHKETVLRRMKWRAYREAETDRIVNLITRQADAIIAMHRRETRA